MGGDRRYSPASPAVEIEPMMAEGTQIEPMKEKERSKTSSDLSEEEEINCVRHAASTLRQLFVRRLVFYVRQMIGAGQLRDRLEGR